MAARSLADKFPMDSFKRWQLFVHIRNYLSIPKNEFPFILLSAKVRETLMMRLYSSRRKNRRLLIFQEMCNTGIHMIDRERFCGNFSRKHFLIFAVQFAQVMKFSSILC